MGSTLGQRASKILWAATIGVGLTAGAAPGQSTTAESAGGEPTRADLIRKIEELQTRVNDIERTAARKSDLDAKQVGATVDAVLRDADRRSQLLQPGGFTAGYTKDKFVIQSEDGNFLLHPYVQFLFRHGTTYREEAQDDGDDDVQNGFEVRRLKFGLDGNVFTKDLTYQFLWATDRKSGNLVLEEGWANYKFTDALAVRAGQLKNFFAHEAMSSSRRLFAGERSTLNDVFVGGDNFVQGVGLLYDKGNLRTYTAYTDGSNNANQNFQDFPTNRTNFGFVGRVEYKVFGDWKSYEDFTALGNKQDALIVGAAADYTEVGDVGTILHTVDAQYETGPLGMYGAYLGRSIKRGADTDLYEYGFLVQAGYLLGKQWEPFARYSYIHFDANGLDEGVTNEVQEITGGVNYYIKGHAAKFTTDLTWFPNGTPVSSDSGDVLANPGGGNEIVLRVQFQLLL